MSSSFTSSWSTPLHWLKRLITGAALIAAPGFLTAAVLANEVIIVKSSDNVYYNTSATTLIEHADDSLSFRVLLPEQLDTTSSNAGEGRLFVSFGVTAAEAVRRLDADARLISAYLTLEQYRELAIDDQLAILLDQPQQRYLAFCKLLLDPDSVGIILDESTASDSSLASRAQDLGISLNQYQLDTGNKLLPVLRQLLRENDALMMLPVQSIYNPDTLKAVLLSSYRNRKPAISYSPAHVRAGALASIYSSPVDIGRHLAQVINRRVEHPTVASGGFEYARFYSIATNPSVAQALAIELPDEHILRSELDRVQP